MELHTEPEQRVHGFELLSSRGVKMKSKKKFIVTYRVTYACHTEVLAENEQKAIEAVMKMPKNKRGHRHERFEDTFDYSIFDPMK